MSIENVRPDPGGVSARRRPGRGRVMAIAAASILLVAAGVTAWALVHGPAEPAASGRSCPRSQPLVPDGLPVPALPTAATPDDALIPDRAPDAVLLCEYQNRDVPDPDARLSDLEVTLSRSADARGSDVTVAQLVQRLRSAPLGPQGADAYCVASSSLTTAPSLVAFRYVDGVVWIAAPGPCGDGSTNGTVSSPTDVSTDVAAALDRAGGGAAAPPSGTQPADPPSTTAYVPRTPSWDEPCGSDAEPPDAVDLLPWQPVSVVVCHRERGGPTAVPSPVGAVHPESVAVALAGQLAALPTDDSASDCTYDRSAETWLLLFTNAAGDQLTLAVETGDCPTVTNGQTNRVADTALLARLSELDPD